MRIFLLGFMGSGKSYTGKKLAAAIGRPFIDLDDWVEAAAGKTIKQIFAEQGEAHFRKLERQTLHSLANLPSFVLACGGGTPCFHDNMSWMNRHGRTFFLDVDVQTLTERLKRESGHRPLLQDGQPIEQIVREKLANRRKFYEKAQVQLRTDNPQADLARLVYEKIITLQGQ